VLCEIYFQDTSARKHRYERALFTVVGDRGVNTLNHYFVRSDLEEMLTHSIIIAYAQT